MGPPAAWPRLSGLQFPLRRNSESGASPCPASAFQTLRLPPWLQVPVLWAFSAFPSSCSWSISKGRCPPTAVSIPGLLGGVGVGVTCPGASSAPGMARSSLFQRWEQRAVLDVRERRDPGLSCSGPKSPQAPSNAGLALNKYLSMNE